MSECMCGRPVEEHLPLGRCPAPARSKAMRTDDEAGRYLARLCYSYGDFPMEWERFWHQHRNEWRLKGRALLEHLGVDPLDG